MINNIKRMIFILWLITMFIIGWMIGDWRRNTSQGQVITDVTYQETYQDDISQESYVPPNFYSYFSPEEIPIIIDAGRRNNLNPEQMIILFAIRKAENGKENLAFGIMNPKANTFDLQAGWCAATIYKNQQRWEQAGRSGDFITFLGSRYCPTMGNLSETEKKLNKNWVPNVKYWIKKIKG